MKYLSAIIFFFIFSVNHSQQIDSTYTKNKNGISKPSLLSTHPFGIFFSRIQGNFKTHVGEHLNIQIAVESGNVWGTQIKTYIPNNLTVRDEVRKHEWHQAQYFFDEETLDSKLFELQIDGVIKGFHINTNFKIADKHELNVGLRIFALTKGKMPFSSLTSDKFIENFHDNVAGGNDPFDREVFGYNRANISYLDRNGNVLQLNNNDLFIGGIETSYYYYPNALSKYNLFLSFGGHLGTNLSKYNMSLDLGLSANIVKKIIINLNSYLHFGVGFGALRKNALLLNNHNIDFGTNPYIGHLENVMEYNFVSKGKTTHSFGVDLYFQTSLNKKDEFKYIIPIRNTDAHKAWGHGVTNLYKNNNYWTFLYSFTRKTTTTFYVQQDFTVNNNPDIQTGMSIKFNVL